MNQRMSLTWIICAPLFIVFVLAASVFQQYLYDLNQEIDDAYADIQQQLERAEKVVTALDYTFTHNHARQRIYCLNTQPVWLRMFAKSNR